MPAVGPLLPELAQLEHLEVLDLHGNAFHGSLPLEWGGPEAFPELTQL